MLKILQSPVFALLLLFGASGCSGSRALSTVEDPYQKFIDSVTRKFVPDKRTAIFDIAVNGDLLRGKTNIPEAKEALEALLRANGLSWRDSIQLLPAAVLGEEFYAVANNSVSNLRSNPQHSAELSTQALLGTPLKIWEKQGSWYRVQMPDDYLGWMDSGGLQLMDSLNFRQWAAKPKIIYTGLYGFAYNAADRFSTTVADLVFGNILELEGEDHGFFIVRFPDGRRAFVNQQDAAPYERWVQSRQASEENFVRAARKMMGIPYLWGGTSFKGVDCSGFTKTVFLMNGWIIPRDASQQIKVGEQIDTVDNWRMLKPGDLLFFGRPATAQQPERVIHVGMWIGNQEFIHSSNQVRISSINPNAPNYDDYERKRFLRVKRLRQSDILDLRTVNIFQTP